MIPSGYKEDKIFTQLPEDGSGDLTFTRASDGTRVNSEGYIERVPLNLVQQSNAFTTSPWAGTRQPLTSGQTGYDGSSNGWSAVPSATLDTHYFNQVLSIADGVVTISIYVKANGYNYFTIRDASNSNTYAKFDLNLGLTETTGSAAISSAIDSVGNGWFRCSLTLNRVAGGSNNLIFYTNNTYTNATIYSGDGISGIYIQDAQINEGPTAKPYFPTTNRQDVPRLDYSNGCPCLLLEPQRTNLVTYSEQFDNAAWTKQGITITPNATESPDGYINADKIVGSASAGNKITYQVYSITYGQAVAVSAFFKKSEYKLAFLRLGGQTQGPYVIYNLDTQQLVSTSGATSTKIESYGNGWFRVSLTMASASSTTAAPNVSFLPDTGYTLNTVNVPAYTGNGTSGGFAWGVQLEANGASYPTSYIPTTSAAVTRVADSCYKTGASSLIGQTEGTMYWEGSFQNSVNPILLQLIPSTTSSYTRSIYIEYTSGLIRTRAFASGALQAQISVSASLNTNYKIAFAYAQNDFVAYVNGTNIGSDSSGTVQSGLSQIYVGGIKGAITEVFMGTKLNQLALFKTRLTNDQLAALTTL
jgi:hypothetical protein